MDREYSGDRFAASGVDLEVVPDVDPAQHQHTAVLLHLAGDFPDQIVIAKLDLARCQRAGKSARESATSRGDDVVDRRRVRFHAIHLDTVVLRDRAMDTEQDRLALGG
jgi:hypothetical protein